MKLFKHLICGLAVVLMVLSTQVNTSYGQSTKRYKSKARLYSKWRYQSAVNNPAKACHIANKKRVKGNKIKSRHRGGKKVRFAEGGSSGFNPYNNDLTSSSRTFHVEKTDTKSSKSLAEISLGEKHGVEDDVLKRNNFSEPTSKKHEQIRKNVEEHLANFEEEKPLKLEPLHFVVDQDEFAFVDMNPFLIAVEYALQGKHALIEGHTDTSGQSDYNVHTALHQASRTYSSTNDRYGSI